MVTQDELNTAYSRGIDAGWRKGEYAGNTSMFIDNPYPAGSPQASQWEEGFGDGTEDFIAWQRSDW